MNFLIVDDHAVVRNGLIQILAKEFPGARFAEAEDGERALAIISEGVWDVIVLDLHMPKVNGLDVLKKVHECRPSIPILVLSMHPEEQFGTRVLKAGAAGYLTKESAPEELVIAVRKVKSGKRYISPAVADRLASQIVGGEKPSGLDNLSEREFTVLRLLYEGHPMKEIAARLTLSPKTISTYRQRILDKLGVTSNAELVQYVLKHHVFDLPPSDI